MLASRYMTSVKNIPSIFETIRKGTAPDKFSTKHLMGIGFKSSQDRAVINILKELKFLTSDGVPTERYHAYRSEAESKFVLAEALREAYDDIFMIDEDVNNIDKQTIKGKFKSTHNTSDRVADFLTNTFLALVDLADFSKLDISAQEDEKQDTNNDSTKSKKCVIPGFNGLRYNIQIHLPATKDIEVYNAIFKSLKYHLCDD